MKPLTDIKVKTVKPGEKTLQLNDGRGLYLEVSPKGGKWWRFRYTFNGKPNRLSLGTYPDVSLSEARERREQARKLLANGIHPGQANKKKKVTSGLQGETFEVIAREWHERYKSKWTENTTKTILSRLENDIFPYIGSRPIKDISSVELLTVIRRIEERGAIETARRDLQKCGEIFRYAVITSRADKNVAVDLRGAIPPPKQRHFASIQEPKEVGALLRACDGYKGSLVVRCALRLAPLTFVRPGELRHAEWTEVDLEKQEWHIPALRMKMKRKHIVPLSRQAISIFEEIYPLTGSGRYVFPGERSWARPMSENAILAALRRLGYPKGEMTGHGFRSMASTLLHEKGISSRLIERQLAHSDKDKVRSAYDYAEHLPERRKMMQDWADYLDTLKATRD